MFEGLKKWGGLFHEGRMNHLYIRQEGIYKNFQKHISEINYKRANITCRFSLFYSLFNLFSDYFIDQNTFSNSTLSVFKPIDLILFFSLSGLTLVLIWAKKRGSIKDLIVLILISLLIINFGIISSIEQYEFKMYPSFIISILVISVIFILSSSQIVFIYFLGFISILSFHDIINYSDKTPEVYYFLSVLILPIIFFITKINYNNQESVV